MQPLRVFIGYDDREAVAFQVLAHSILSRASVPVAITPLMRAQLRDVHARARGPLESTDFSITRFLVPHLSGYEGVSVFMDCDMLVRADIWDLISAEWWDHAVWVVKHDYVPRSDVKFLGQKQTAYPRKNWSSLIVFDNARCRALTPEYVNTAPALDLHRFAWLRDDEVGMLPLDWNWLVGEYAANPDAKVLHYTLGGPWFDGYRACDHAEEWFRERNSMLGAG